MKAEGRRLPEAKEITVKLRLNEAKECLRYLPKGLESVRGKIEEAIEYANFWNFLRDCEHLEAVRANFHLTGLLNPPAWILYCKHPENKGERRKLYVKGVSEDVKGKMTGTCDRESCPIYRRP